MKRVFATLSALIFSLRLFCQEPLSTNKKNFFCISPFDLFINTLQLSYERHLGDNSIAVMGGYKLAKKKNQVDRPGGNAEIQFRINLLYKTAGTYKNSARYSTFPFFAPFLQYRYEDIRGTWDSRSGTVVNSLFAGLGFGIRLTGLENRFTMSLFAGGGMRFSDITGTRKYDDFLQVGYTGIAPKISCYIGIAF